MSNKCTVPFWSIDAFLSLISPRARSEERIWSSELMSRVSTFVDAYVLFDKIVLPERYKNELIVFELDPNGEVFEYVSSSTLSHSDDLSKGITLDLSLDSTNFEELEKENYKWFSQHQGYIDRDSYESIMGSSSMSMAAIRVWQLSLLNEISDVTSSTSLLPLSLQSLEVLDRKNRVIPFHIDKLNELNDNFQNNIKSITAHVGESFSDYLCNIPPLFSLLIDQSMSPEHTAEVLRLLRTDYKEFRELGNQFKNEISKASALRDKKDILEQWNDSWEQMASGSFRKPQCLRRNVSSADFSKAVVKPESAGISTMLQSFLEYREETKSYNRFKIYDELYSELDAVCDLRKKLSSNFSIALVNELKP